MSTTKASLLLKTGRQQLCTSPPSSTYSYCPDDQGESPSLLWEEAALQQPLHLPVEFTMVEDESKKLPKGKAAKVEPAAEPVDASSLDSLGAISSQEIIVKQETNKPAASESRKEAQTGGVAVEPLVVWPEGRLLYTIMVKEKLFQPTENFTEFIRDLRDILAGHLDHEDICDRHQDTNLRSTRNHPVLAKQRADGDQLARWIEVKLQVAEDNQETTTSTTLVMRDDYMDIMGFMNQYGYWFELGNWRALPPEYRSVLLGWGNSYKSILDAGNAEEVVDKLTSANLGKSFATDAVRLLSCYDPAAVADPDGDNLSRLALVGLSVMVCDSARMNPVRDIIVHGWNTGTGYNARRMCCYIWKYKNMSRALRRWKISNYAEARPKSQLDAIYLVLNEEYTIGDLLPVAYPKTLKESFPEMFKEMSMATVQVRLRRVHNKNNSIEGVYGEIGAFIRDEQRHSVSFQVGSMLFKHTEETGHSIVRYPEGSLQLVRSAVAVPSGWVLRLEVDLHIKIPDSNKIKDLKVNFDFSERSLSRKTECPRHTGMKVEVKITWEKKQHFPSQLTCPVEVLKTMFGQPTVVYTIGDAMSFTEFIMTLRSILADHSDREDILDGYNLLNLTSTREHPSLAKMRSVLRAARWLHVRLQVVEGEEMLSTTLVMRYEDLYIHGFFNQDGHLFKLGESNRNNATTIRTENHGQSNTVDLKWGLSYPSILKVETSSDQYGNKQTADKIVAKLRDKKLGSSLAKHAVSMLSRYTGGGGDYPSREALAYLLIMVCESARMNPLHDSIAAGWSKGTEFTKQMLEDYIWKYADMSEDLRTWKSGGYAKRTVWKSRPKTTSQEKEETHPISQLQAIYLVHSGPPAKSENENKNGKPKQMEKGNRDSSDDQHREDDSTGGGCQESMGAGRGGAHASASQSGEASGSSNRGEHGSMSSRHEDTSGLGLTQQSRESADHAPGHGRYLVELLAVRADVRVAGTKIIVFDRRRGQIIYRKEKKGQEDQEMVDLGLTGPYRGISAYGCFAIEIDIPADAAGSSTGGDATVASTKLTSEPAWQVAAAGDSIIWEWNCYDPGYAAEVDEAPVRPRTISSGPGRNVEVTYAVMSNAREATVQVKLRLKDGPSRGAISGGKITALIDGFKDEHNSVLFNSSESTSTAGNSWFLLQLSRDVVAVPCCRGLKIEVTLQIKTSNDQMVNYSHSFNFYNNGICSTESHKDDDHDSEVQVNITWYPEVKKAPEVVYTIEDDELSFTEFITAFRGILADHPDREDIFDRHQSSILSSTREHPVLAKQRAEQPARWLHVKLQAMKGEQMLSTTLLVRDDNLYVCGFLNQQGDSFELIESPNKSADILPVDEYSPRRLSWGVRYRSLMDADNEDDLARRLARVTMGANFARKAVHVLSCFPAWADGNMNPRMALAGLIVMVCESARMKRINNFIELCWSDNNKMKFTDDLMRDFVLKYGSMSHELLRWKSEGYIPKRNPTLQKQHIYLVLNSRMYRPPHQGSLEGHGRPRVELLAMRADFGVVGTTITVFDGKQGHIIYREEAQGKEEQGDEKGNLVLTGPCTGISAYGCFAIKIDIPGPHTSTGNAGGSIKWEWDCYDPEYAREVDKGPVTRTISSSGPEVKVTYAVMSDALEATVQVKLRMKDGNNPCSIHGHITTQIGDIRFQFERPITLFRRTLEAAQHLSPTHSNVLQLPRSLKLDRNVVAVPRGQTLHLRVFLHIQTSNERGVSYNPRFIDIHLICDNDILRQHRNVYGDEEEVEVTVAWYPDSSTPSRGMKIEEKKQRRPDMSYKVGQDAQGFSTFITELRRLVAEHPRCKDLLADHHPAEVSFTSNYHPVLPKGRVTREPNMSPPAHIKPGMLFYIKLEAPVEGVDKTSSMTLVMQNASLDVIGFINQNGVYYEPNGPRQLPSEYNINVLPWGKDYGSILNATSLLEGEEILGAARLGMAFAEDAVRCLSRFDDVGPSERAKRSLVGLMIMVCDSARMEPFREAIAGAWKDGTKLTNELQGYRRNWVEISRALLDWKDHAYQGWPHSRKIESIGIKSADDALKAAPLVFNDENRICPP